MNITITIQDNPESMWTMTNQELANKLRGIQSKINRAIGGLYSKPNKYVEQELLQAEAELEALIQELDPTN